MSHLWAKIDVTLPRDTRMIKAGPLARLLYIQCVLYARENLTDGHIDAVLLPVIAVDIPRAKGLMSLLVGVGAVDETEDGWVIPMDRWRRYNPLRSEIDALRKAETERKAAYRVSGRCPEDVPAGQARHATRDARKCPNTPEGEGEGEKEKTPPPAPHKMQDPPTQAPRVGGGKDIAKVIELAVDVEQSRQTAPVRYPDRWRAKVRDRINTNHGTAIAAALTAGRTPEETAATVLGISLVDIARIRQRGGYA